MTISKVTNEFYSNPVYHLTTGTPVMDKFTMIHRYRDALVSLQNSIGTEYNELENEDTRYGRPFSELAE